MKYILYLTWNKVNGHFYVGVHETEDPNIWDYFLAEDVYSNNPKTYFRGKTAFQSAITKYGVKSFVRTTLRVFNTKKEALEAERMIVDYEFISRPDTYNSILTNGNKYPTIKENLGYINQYNKEGVFLKSFDNALEASRALDIDKKRILNAAYKKCKTDGYYFLLGNDSLNSPSKEEAPIYKYGEYGDFICEYKGISEIKNQCKLNKGKVLRAMKNIKPLRGFYWSYGKYNNILKEHPERTLARPTKIYQYTLDGEFVKEWRTITECKKEFPAAVQVCQGKRTHCHNFKFSFDKPKI